MPSAPTLTDGDVRLRAHREEDVERCLEQCLDPLSRRWTTVPLTYTRDDAREFVRHVMPAGWDSDQEWGFAVEYQGRFAGTVSLRNERAGRAEIAYGAHPDVRGTGAMERALRLLLAWGFVERELQTIIWWANVGNWASRKIAWRLGFSHDGAVRSWLDHRGDLVDGWVGTLLAGEELLPRHPWLDVPRVVGERVALRRHRDGDAARVQQACADEETQRWLGTLPRPYTLANAETFLALRETGMAAGTDLHWMLADLDDDRALGTISLMSIADGTAEVGYWAHPDARGRGAMTDAVRLVVRHAFVPAEDGGLGLRRLTLYVAAGNGASARVAERNGFRRTGVQRQAAVVRGGHDDLIGFDLLAADVPLR